MDNHLQEDGRALLGRWSSAKMAVDDIKTNYPRTGSLQKVPNVFEIVANERNLRREVEKWLWDNAVNLLS